MFKRRNCSRYICKLLKRYKRSMRAKIPFGIGQIGKSFRNEITPEILYLELENLNKWN